MTSFQSNIISIYGEKGKTWLNGLPQLIASVSSRLGLRHLKELSNLSYHYVLSGVQGNRPIILKLGLDTESLKREGLALKCFAGCGAVKMIIEEDGMLLLERAVLGTSLKSYFPDKEPESIKIACHVMKKLHQVSIPEDHDFPRINGWLTALDKDWGLPSDCLQKARKLRDQLLQNSGSDVLLHGDLHHDNILQNGDGWVAIDPAGVIGEPAFEVAAFIRNPIPDLLSAHNTAAIIKNRIAGFATLLALPSQRILDWCFVQAVLAWVWAIEDNCNTEYFDKMTRLLYNVDVLSE